MGFLRKKGLFDGGKVLFLPIETVIPNPEQPRKYFDEEKLEELASSIREIGILQPLSVRRREGYWELVAGERRLRAAKLAGLTQVPCLAITADDRSSSLLALVENLQRRDLDFWEEALALRRLLEEFDLTQEECARRIGKSQSAVANKLRLLKLPEEVLELLRLHNCSERHARALLPLEDPELQRKAAGQVVKLGLTVAQTEALVDKLLSTLPKKKKPTFIIKDVRLFLNTISRSLDLMRSAGVDAKCQREENEGEICLTIRIPKGVK